MTTVLEHDLDKAVLIFFHSRGVPAFVCRHLITAKGGKNWELSLLHAALNIVKQSFHIWDERSDRWSYNAVDEYLRGMDMRVIKIATTFGPAEESILSGIPRGASSSRMLMQARSQIWAYPMILHQSPKASIIASEGPSMEDFEHINL